VHLHPLPETPCANHRPHDDHPHLLLPGMDWMSFCHHWNHSGSPLCCSRQCAILGYLVHPMIRVAE